MSDKVRIGLIGTGRIGKLHAENIVHAISKAEIIMAADYYVEPSREWAETLGIPLIKDYRQVIENPDIHAVLICSPTDLHAEMIMAAANAGKHIFCEKPVDLAVDRAREAVNTAQDAGVKLQIGFNRRFDHNHMRVREAVQSGKIGVPHIIQITSRDPAPPPIAYVRNSGGLFKDMAIHDFDMARYLSGSEVTEIFATGCVLIDEEVRDVGDIDTAAILMKFQNGALGIINNSRKAVYGYDQRVEAFCSNGSAMDMNDVPSTVVVSGSDGVFSEKPEYFFLERYNESYILEIRAFVDSILMDKEPPVTGEDGIMSLILAEAAGMSFRENRPVRIHEITSK